VSSSIFGPARGRGGAPVGQGSSLREQVQSFVNMVGGNPDTALSLLMRQNPQFAKFVNDCNGLTPEQILKKYGK
jgi:hypothetical protein